MLANAPEAIFQPRPAAAPWSLGMRGSQTSTALARVGLLSERATLGEVVPPFLSWLAFVRRRGENTVKSYGYDLKTFLEFAQEAKLRRPDDVTFRHLESFLGWLQTTRGASASTANRSLHALRTLWKYLSREGLATGNPAADTFLLPTAKKLPTYLSVAEQEKVLATLAADESHAGRRDYALVATALLTGLRCSELAYLKVAHVNLAAGVLRVVQGKGRKDRELPIVPRLEAILREYLTVARPALVGRSRGSVRRPGNAITFGLYLGHRWTSLGTTDAREARVRAAEIAPLPADAGWVFVNASPVRSHADKRAGESIRSRSIFHLVRRVVEPIVGRHVHPHMLRHSFASRVREAGGDLQLIQEALGHADIRTTVMYAHLSTSRRRQKLAELLT